MKNNVIYIALIFVICLLFYKLSLNNSYSESTIQKLKFEQEKQLKGEVNRNDSIANIYLRKIKEFKDISLQQNDSIQKLKFEQEKLEKESKYKTEIIKRLKGDSLRNSLNLVFDNLQDKYKIIPHDTIFSFVINDSKAKEILLLHSENNTNIELLQKEKNITSKQLLQIQNKNQLIDLRNTEIKKLKSDKTLINIKQEKEIIKINQKLLKYKHQRDLFMISSGCLLTTTILLILL